MNIGIVGYGFVGRAVHHLLSTSTEFYRVRILDPKYTNSLTMDDLFLFAPVAIFLCLPTPENEDGSCDDSLIREYLDVFSDRESKSLIVIKSTITPDHIKYYTENYPQLKLVYNPEFLTAANAEHDITNPDFQLIGSRDEDDCIALQTVYNRTAMKPCPTFCTDMLTASLYKYTMNSWLATKVVWMNEMYKLHQATGCDTTWNEFADMLKADPRLGNSHMNVPGPDGSFGFGGHCFPKDVTALLKYAEQMNINMSVLEQAVTTNNTLRNTEA